MTLTETQKLTFENIRNQGNRGLAAYIGKTPLIQLRRVMRNLPAGVQVFAKAEWFNPSGSIKDRPAIHIIQSAIASGELAAGKRLLDSTSGNMGIAYATLAASIGIGVTLCIPANASPERITVLHALGAELIMTNALEGSDGAILAARKIAAENPKMYWYANQYNNPANWQAHYLTTGPEIARQTEGKISHFVAGLGTSGTLMGTGRYLREQLPATQIIAFQPDDAFHGLEGLKHMPSAIKPGIFDPAFADRTIEIRTEAAHAMVRALAREEGLFAGISSGAAAVAAFSIASELKEGNVITIFPDAGYKYLSDRKLWEGK